MTPQPPVDPSEALLTSARAVLAREAAAIRELEGRLGDDFVAVCRAVLACRGRVVCCGVGKSGIIGRKLAATLASLGTPAFFVHPTEALHGDLGMITTDDVVVLISHSGATTETLAVLEHLDDVRTVALTDEPGSPLAVGCDLLLSPGVAEEADHLGLAPTASTTAALALGDALAVAVAVERGFRREDFAARHPGGALGRSLS